MYATASPFTGLTVPPAQMSTESRTAESVTVAAPWEDDIFEPPRQIFATFGSDNMMYEDPFVTNDPWARASQERHAAVPRPSATSQRVSSEDELSDSQSQTTGHRTSTRPRSTSSAREVTLQRRTNGPGLTDDQLLQILHGQALTETVRIQRDTNRPPRTSARFLMHTLPISSAPSNSVQAVHHMTLPPVQGPPPMNRILQSVSLVAAFRAGRREREGDRLATAPEVPAGSQRAESAASARSPSPRGNTSARSPSPFGGQTVESAPELLSVPSSSSEDARSQPPAPVIYEGTDDHCSICTDTFSHGERVCRLSCRHMFHAACWDHFLENARRTTDRFSLSCPNCRGAGTLIAVWPFIDASRTTQVVGGRAVDNLLESSASFYNVEAPEVPTPPTPRSTDIEDRTYALISGPPSFHIQTRLADGRPSIIVDPGSVGNLCGDKWAKEVATIAARNGHKPSYEKRPRPLNVSGVGNGSNSCHYDCKLPVALQQADQGELSVGHLTVPAVHNSDIPGLPGLTALRKNRAILDFNTLRLHFCGPGDCDMSKALPPGTDTFQLEVAPNQATLCFHYANS